MTTASLTSGRALFVIAGVVATHGCTFPDYIVAGETTSSTSGAGGATGSTTGSKGSSTTTTSSSTSTTTSATTGTSTGSTMGPTCSQPCDTTKGATCKSACDATPDPECDCDGDGQILDTVDCKAAHPAAQIDCYDCNVEAKKGATAYFIHDRGDGDFDYDCNNLEDVQYDLECGVGALTCSKPYVYDATPGCGNDGNLHACDVPALACKKEAPFNVTAQACH